MVQPGDKNGTLAGGGQTRKNHMVVTINNGNFLLLNFHLVLSAWLDSEKTISSKSSSVIAGLVSSVILLEI